MKIEFTKMHGLGNDFILIDIRGQKLPNLPGLARMLCHRRFGVGADQMILLDNPSSKYIGSADCRMGIFNRDGSEVEMCGNGIRCLAKYVWDRGISSANPLRVETLAGLIQPEKDGRMVRVDMGAPEFEGRKIPVELDGRVIDRPLKINGAEFKITCVSMGNPHAAIFVDDVELFPVDEYGPKIENHDLFPERTNVEFVKVLSHDEIRMRVWERGSGETMACGTGAAAVHAAARIKGLVGDRSTIHLNGGDLIIEWPGEGRLFMTGPAAEVFRGAIEV